MSEVKGMNNFNYLQISILKKIMKTKTILSLILVFAVLFYLFVGNYSNFTEPSAEKSMFQPPPLNGWGDKFYIGAIAGEQDWYHSPSFQQLDDLGFNLWHAYIGGELVNGRYYPIMRWEDHGVNINGHTTTDDLSSSVSSYAGDVNRIIDDIYSHNNGRRLLIMRPKIEWLCNGQSSVYKASYVSPSDPLWFYSFQVNLGESTPDNDYGNGDMVLHCSEPVLGPGGRYILQRLKANTEQCRRVNDTDYNQWQGDSFCNWYIKPSIRIDKDYANNPANWETVVCRIDVYNADGNDPDTDPVDKNRIKSIDIRVRNFKPDVVTQYDGNYLDTFYFQPWNDTSNQVRSGDWATERDQWLYKARGNAPNDNGSGNKTDIRVYWYDNCQMWINYVKVDNDVANDLLDGIRDNWITDEVQQIGLHPGPGSSEPAILRYYLEYCEFNNIPCLAYVNHKIDSLSNGKLGLMQDFFQPFLEVHVPWTDRASLESVDFLYQHYIQKAEYKQIFAECYPLNACWTTNQNGQLFSSIPSTLPNTSGNFVLAQTVSPAQYDDSLQKNLFYKPSIYEGGEYDPVCNNSYIAQYPGNFRRIMQVCNSLSKLSNIPFIFMPQVHQCFNSIEVHREPTNEELNMISNVAASYGAKGILFWEFPSEDRGSSDYITSLTETWQGPLREANYYNQGLNDPPNYKWQIIKNIVDRLTNKWGSYLLSFNNTNTNSYIYNFENERNDLTINTYFSGLVTYKPGTIQEDCNELNPPPSQSGLIYDCVNNRYLQIATFQNNNTENAQYFMIVNRRCSPHYEPGVDPRFPDGENGGSRDVRVRFQDSKLLTYNNWKIIDLANNQSIYYTKGQYPYLADLGWYMPGEGRLYKMLPVMKAGGILAGNEDISGQEFTCTDTVYSNGYNITLGSGTTIHFTDTSTIVMNGGTFQMGDSSYHGSPNVTVNALSGNSWHGLSFTNCTVKIYNSTFSNIKNDTSYALNIIDCHTVDIRNSIFNTEGGDIKGGINFTYYNQMALPPNAYIGGNTFNWDKSKVPAINIMSDAGTIMPVIIENNTLNSSSTTGSTAIMLSGISGGAIKSNYINNFDKSITALSSSIDISENNISSNISGSVGINTGSGTEIRLNNVGVEILGGMNNISNTDSSSINIKVDNSYFLIDNGQNIFNLGAGLPSYHLKGYFPDGYSYGTQETQNCFTVNNTLVDPPIDSVTIGEGGDQPGFNFYPYLTGCTMGGFGQQIIVNLGDGIYDTIDTRNGGGGEPSIFILTPKTLYDSISIQMRFRNYNYVKTKCTELINTYPDSIQSLNSISKLYLATTATDTTQAGMSTLKTFYENLILNHTNNTALVKRCNYFVQKCKVKLRQYSSALAGFQQIINENPYSYEGLVAKWDYMATHLLDSLGQGGGEAPSDLTEEGNNDPHDKTPWTKEQKKVIKTAINTSLEDSRRSDEQKIEGLTQLAKSGNVDAAVKLKIMKILKEVIKTQAPKNIIEHIKIVNSDIQKVFGNPNSKSKNRGSNLPTVFYLSQNYPNPFNPTTKINFDLPKDVKVKIMVYDVLGREVIKLVDEFKKAGRYTIEFNGNIYASGVYFYRIQAGEFVQAKKMVLIK